MADKLKLVDQYAIRLLESDPNAYSEEWNADYERGFLDAIDKALELPTIEAEPDNGWISVKDRLPEPYENVLVFGNFTDIVTCQVDFLDDYGRWFRTFYVTHWQHLPEPPKEDAK